MSSMNELTARLMKTGSDETKLGRWTWMHFEGSNNHKTRVISAYRPCKGTEIGSVYAQHQRYFQEQEDFTCPLKLFDKDFSAFLRSCNDNMESIIVHLDANEDLLNPECGTRKAFERNGMHNPIFSLHQATLGNPPATQNRNRNGANIDAFFVSYGLEVSRGGYFAHGEAFWPSHCTMMFIDITRRSFLGGNPPFLNRVQPTRIDPTDPRNLARYAKLTKEGFANAEILPKVATMRKLVAAYNSDGSANLDEIISLHHKISCLNLEIRTKAGAKTKKLTVGAVPSSKAFKRATEEKALWILAVRWHQNVHVSKPKIRRLAK